MKKRTFFAGLLVVALMTGLLLMPLTWVTARKDETLHYQDFYRYSEKYDLLFFGSSYMLNGVLPTELWQNYGICAYNLSTYAAKLDISYWTLKSALEYSHPKMVVVECSFLSHEGKIPTFEGVYHAAYDQMPFGLTKVNFVLDTLDDLSKTPEYLWNFVVYHGRWNELKESDYRIESLPTLGTVIRTQYAENPEPFVAVDSPAAVVDESARGIVYLRKIIALCKQNNIELMLVFNPRNPDVAILGEIEAAKSIAKEEEILFFNGINEEILLQFDPGKDYADSSHLNLNGAHLFTEILGRLLYENCTLPDRREERGYQFMEYYYQNYTDYLSGELADTGFLPVFFVKKE